MVPSGVSRKNRLGFQFWLQSFFHAKQNVQFAEKFEKSSKRHRIRIRNHAFVSWASPSRWIVNSIWLVQTSNTLVILQCAGQFGQRHAIEDLVRTVAHFGSFSMISRDPSVRFWWWRTNQILQGQAHPLVPSRCPGKIVLASNFGSKVFSMPCKMFSSQKSQKNQRKYIEFVSEIMLSYHGRPWVEE